MHGMGGVDTKCAWPGGHTANALRAHAMRFRLEILLFDVTLYIVLSSKYELVRQIAAGEMAEGHRARSDQRFDFHACVQVNVES